MLRAALLPTSGGFGGMTPVVAVGGLAVTTTVTVAAVDTVVVVPTVTVEVLTMPRLQTAVPVLVFAAQLPPVPLFTLADTSVEFAVCPMLSVNRTPLKGSPVL